MKRALKFMWISLCILFSILCFAGCQKQVPEPDPPGKDQLNTSAPAYEEPATQTLDKLPVTRALAAKMIALVFIGQENINSFEIAINFTDVEKGTWYYKYINAVTLTGYMAGTGDEFNPEKPLSINEAQILLNNLDANNKIQIKITDENKDLPISHALWQDLFNRCLDNLSNAEEIRSNILQIDVVPLALDSNSALPPGSMVTDKGVFNISGFDMDGYIDKKITVQLKDNQLIGLLGTVDYAPVIANVYILGIENNMVTIFCEGAIKTYLCDVQAQAHTVADITLNNGVVTAVSLLDAPKSGIIKRATAKNIELDKEGLIPVSENLKIYALTGQTVKQKKISEILPEQQSDYIYMKDGKISAIILNEQKDLDTIRIAISTSDYKSLFHSGVEITCTSDFTVETYQGQIGYKKGELLKIDAQTNADLFNSERITIEPEKGGEIEIRSINRGQEGTFPKYRNKLEIAKADHAFILVNEIDFEEYLYGILSGAMPETYGIEALKAQAVVIRGNAYNQFYMNNFLAYGANVDDSSNSQRYMEVPENALSLQAVNETKNQYLVYENEVISANFFLSSSGYTANAGEVWPDKKKGRFPGITPDYLTAQKQYESDQTLDILNEPGMLSYYRNNETLSLSWESGQPWFRWQVTMTTEELSNSINQNLRERYLDNTKLILTVNDTGNPVSQNIETIGKLKNIEITQRGEGGNVMQIKLEGSQATVLVNTDYNIRTLLKPYQYIEDGENIHVIRNDQSVIANYNLLPSAFFAIEKTVDENGELSSVTFFGGGNGHGVGMSQMGAKDLSEMGITYDEILRHYYKGSSLISL